jgi:hypothetical protein
MVAVRALGLACVLGVVGCGRVGFEPLSEGLGGHGGALDAPGTSDSGGGGGGGTSDGRDAATSDAAGGGGDASMLGGDASMLGSDASSGACVPPDPASATTFPAGAPCNGWGTETVVSATVQQTGDELLVSPNPSSFGAQGYCKRPGVLYGAAGTLLQIGSVIVGPGGVTGMQLGTGGTALELVDDAGMLTAQDASGTIAQAPYDAATMSWFWIHPNAAGTGSVFETSPDGLTWTTFTTTSQAPAASNAVIVIAATLTGSNPAPGTARFESFDLCP